MKNLFILLIIAAVGYFALKPKQAKAGLKKAGLLFGGGVYEGSMLRTSDPVSKESSTTSDGSSDGSSEGSSDGSYGPVSTSVKPPRNGGFVTATFNNKLKPLTPFIK